MKKLLVAAVLFPVVFISACATSRPAMQEVPLPPQRIILNGYSLVPLDEKGWVIGLRSHETLVLGKRGNDPDENMIIRAFAEVLPPLKSDEEFIGFAKSVLVMEGAARHKVLSQQTKLVKIKSQPCVRTDTVMEDHNAVKRSSRTDPDDSGSLFPDVQTPQWKHRYSYSVLSQVLLRTKRSGGGSKSTKDFRQSGVF